MAEWTDSTGAKKHSRGGMVGGLISLMHTKTFGAKRRARHKNAQRKHAYKAAGGTGAPL